MASKHILVNRTYVGGSGLFCQLPIFRIQYLLKIKIIWGKINLWGPKDFFHGYPGAVLQCLSVPGLGKGPRIVVISWNVNLATDIGLVQMF